MAPDLPLVARWQRATHLLLRELDASLSSLGLTPAEINVLACFGGAEHVAVRALAGSTGQRPSTLTGVLDRLEGRGLVRRQPRPGDRRALDAALTARGRRAARQVAAAFAQLEEVLGPATEAEAVLARVEETLGR